jgi:3',5'-cyclic AMP phosphodiesterase CpdA
MTDLIKGFKAMNELENAAEGQMSRRSFLQGASLFLVGGSFAASSLLEAASGMSPLLRAGLVTDVHHADVAARGTRHYRDSVSKLKLAVEEWKRQRVDFVIETGDFVDAPEKTSERIEIAYLREVDQVFRSAGAPTHYVLGNHCVNAMSKSQFLATVKRKESWYSWDQGGWHWVVLDACFRKDGVSYEPKNFVWTDTEIPADQRDWLKADLAETQLPTVVFVHQRLDLPRGDNYAIWSSEEVRKIIAGSGRVSAVIMGHSHRNHHVQIDGVHYLVTAATVEGAGVANAGYSVLKAHRNGTLELEGFVTHKGHPFASAKPRV